MRTYLVSSLCCAVLLGSASAFAQAPPPADTDVPVLPAEEEGAAPPQTPPPRAAPAKASSEYRGELRSSPARYRSSTVDELDVDAEPRNDLVRVNAGLRLGYVTSRGFDTFATSDVLTQFSIDGTYPIFTTGKLVLGVGLGWDVGGRSDSVRGVASSLTAHRFYVPIEGRYALLPGLQAFLKVSPGAAVSFASVESTTANELSATGWAFSTDASVGASILLGPRKDLERRKARFWITPEFGYSVTTAAKLSAGTGREDAALLGNDESTNLRALALSGVFWRASLGMTF